MAFRSLLLRVLLILTLVLDGTAAADCHERHGQRVPLASAVAAHRAHRTQALASWQHHYNWHRPLHGIGASPLCLDFPPQETTS